MPCLVLLRPVTAFPTSALGTRKDSYLPRVRLRTLVICYETRKPDVPLRKRSGRPKRELPGCTEHGDCVSKRALAVCGIRCYTGRGTAVSHMPLGPGTRLHCKRCSAHRYRTCGRCVFEDSARVSPGMWWVFFFLPTLYYENFQVKREAQRSFKMLTFCNFKWYV